MKNVMPLFVMRINGRSMLPTFSPNDRVVVNKLSYLVSSPSVNDIIVLTHPYTDRIILKRIIAGPLSCVKVDGSILEVNDIPQKKYMPDGVRQYKKYTINVPEESYFIIGDNPYHSTDSRHFGAVNKSNIIGKVVQRFATGKYAQT